MTIPNPHETSTANDPVMLTEATVQQVIDEIRRIATKLDNAQGFAVNTPTALAVKAVLESTKVDTPIFSKFVGKIVCKGRELPWKPPETISDFADNRYWVHIEAPGPDFIVQVLNLAEDNAKTHRAKPGTKLVLFKIFDKYYTPYIDLTDNGRVCADSSSSSDDGKGSAITSGYTNTIAQLVRLLLMSWSTHPEIAASADILVFLSTSGLAKKRQQNQIRLAACTFGLDHPALVWMEFHAIHQATH